MFYYAEINSEYQVINKYCLSEESTNPNYIPITEDLYNNGNELGDIVGQFYNKLLDIIEIVDPGWDMGQTCWMRYKNSQMRLSTKLDNMEYDINNLADSNANSVSQADLQVLEDTIATKADVDHSHSEYSLVGHTHDDYVLQTSFDSTIATLESEIEGKADASHTHSEYSNVNHNHDSNYAPLSHSHTDYVTSTTFNTLVNEVDSKATEDYVNDKVGAITVESIGALPNTTIIPTVPTNVSAFTNDAGYLTEHQSLDGLATEIYVNTQIDAIDIPNALSDLTTDSTHRVVTDVEKATWNAKSDFSGSYNDLTDKPTIPSISGLATETYVDEAISTKADNNHTHGDIYYTETEVNSLLTTKSDNTHNHDTFYDALGSASSALASAKVYADELIEDEVANRNSAIATAKSSAISTAASDATTKANNALASAKTYADSVGTTVKNDLLNGAGSAYDTLKELGDLIIDNADAIEALETITSGKANASHTHAISDVTGLQSALDGKANASHGTHVFYSTTAPVMDGSASVGSATTVARSDHKHPTDTSRAAQTDLDSHTSNKSNPHGVTLAQLGITATATELNVLDGITATVTELNYVDGVTSNIQTQLNAKAASSHTHSYAGSSSVGGAATSANKLNTNAGSATQPVYFSNGVPVATTYTLNKTVPSNAVFTDTTYSAATTSNAGLMSASDKSKLDGITASADSVSFSASATSGNKVGSITINGTTTNMYSPTQTSVSGNAGTATTISKRVKITSSQSANAGKYIKFGTITLSSAYSGFMGYLMFNPTETSAGTNGLLHLYIRNGSSVSTTSCAMKWLTLNESKYEKTVFAVKVSDGVFDLYYQPIGTWDTMEIIVVSGDNHGTLSLANSGTYVDSITATYTSAIGGQVNYANSAGSATSATTASTASVCTGNAATATKLATARTISLTGDVTGSTSFDGSGNVSITTTVADDSHNHTIANVDGLQSALDGKSATSHTHSAEALVAMAEALFGTNYQGGVEYSYGSGSGKNVLTEISNMPQGLHTIYSIAGTTGNPETTESYRYFIHKTSTTIGWIYAFGADGSIYSNYLAGANTYKGWKTIHDAKRKPLWTGSYYMTAGHTATPSKKLSQCEHGWMLLWSDYDPDTGTVNNTDFCTTMIPNRNWAGSTWNGASYYCDIPRYSAGTATDSESRVIKVLDVYDNKLVGNANNNAAPRNDVILRAIYEF